jgi:hypothetical protein
MSKGRSDTEQGCAAGGGAPAKAAGGDAPAKATAETARAPAGGRGERLSAALRANLARRKAQARERKEAQMEPPEGNPDDAGAGKTGEGSHDSAGFIGDKRSR